MILTTVVALWLQNLMMETRSAIAGRRLWSKRAGQSMATDDGMIKNTSFMFYL